MLFRSTVAVKKDCLILMAHKAVFFDRDGVLNIDKAYLYKIDELEWIEGALEAITYLTQSGYLVFVVTNQSGIARGYYTVAEMEKLHQTVQKQIFHRNKTTDFQIGIGSIVNGYGDLKKSFKDSKKIIDYMDMLRYLYGDKNISVADFSKLGFFQIFEKIQNRDELMEYVPE